MARTDDATKPEGIKAGGKLPATRTNLTSVKTGTAQNKPANQEGTFTPAATGTPPTPDTLDNLYIDDATEVSQPVIGQPDTPAEKSAQWRLNQSARKMAKKEAGQTALILLSLLDGIAFLAFGAGASMNEYERDLIKEPLERVLMRMDLASSEAVSRLSDPITIVMVLIAWGSRLQQERKEAKRQEAKEEALRPAPKTGDKDNGKTTSRSDELLLPEQLKAPTSLRGQIKGDTIT